MFSDELSKVKAENTILKGKLDEAGRQIDEIDNSDEHAILRKQLESLFKEKTQLSVENSELKKKLGQQDSQYQSPKRASDASKSPRKTNDP